MLNVVVPILFVVLGAICLITASHIHKKSVTFISEHASWKNREIKNKKQWNIAMVFMMVSAVILGLFAGLLVASGLRETIVFKQVYGIPVVILAIPISMLGYMTIHEVILRWEKKRWRCIAIILLILLPISVGAAELTYQSEIETDTDTKIEVLETVQLDPGTEIITCMNIRWEGPFYVFWPKDAGKDGVPGGEDKVLAEQAIPIFIESDPYMEECKVTTVVTAKYPNGKVEEREVATDTTYMFYAPEDLFYGLNDHN